MIARNVSLVAISVVSLAGFGCATKKYVSKEVGAVNEKVESLSESVERNQERRPAAVRIGFRERPADGAHVAHLRIGNAGGTVLDDGIACGDTRSRDRIVPRKRADLDREAAAAA